MSVYQRNPSCFNQFIAVNHQLSLYFVIILFYLLSFPVLYSTLVTRSSLDHCLTEFFSSHKFII